MSGLGQTANARTERTRLTANDNWKPCHTEDPAYWLWTLHSAHWWGPHGFIDHADHHIRQVSIKFRITARQPIAGWLDTSSPPANRRPAAQDSGVWRQCHTTAERTAVCLVATRGTDTVRFFGYQKFCDFYITIKACDVYSLKWNRVW